MNIHVSSRQINASESLNIWSSSSWSLGISEYLNPNSMSSFADIWLHTNGGNYCCSFWIKNVYHAKPFQICFQSWCLYLKLTIIPQYLASRCPHNNHPRWGYCQLQGCIQQTAAAGPSSTGISISPWCTPEREDVSGFINSYAHGRHGWNFS